MGFLRHHPAISALAAILLAALLLIGTTGIAVWRAAHTDGASRVDRADAIIVLGAAQYEGRPSPVFEGRLKHAALLFREGRADTVLVLGAGLPGDVSTEAEAGRNYLVARGLPAGSVIAISEGHTTFESLRAAARFMRDRSMGSAFLVSDPWHNLRIERMASDLAIEGYASATWHSAARSEHSRLSGYVRETFAYLYYRVTGH